MDRTLPAGSNQLANRKSGVIRPRPTYEVHMPVRQRRPYQAGECIKDGTGVLLHRGPFLTVAVSEQCASLSAKVDDTLVSVQRSALRVLASTLHSSPIGRQSIPSAISG